LVPDKKSGFDLSKKFN